MEKTNKNEIILDNIKLVHNSTIQPLDNLSLLDKVLYRNIQNKLNDLNLIQKYVIPVVLDRKHMICQAPTGSGKTLSYLIPVVSRIIQQPDMKVCIISPVRELCVQISRECYDLIKGIRINRSSNGSVIGSSVIGSNGNSVIGSNGNSVIGSNGNSVIGSNGNSVIGNSVIGSSKNTTSTNDIYTNTITSTTNTPYTTSTTTITNTTSTTNTNDAYSNTFINTKLSNLSINTRSIKVSCVCGQMKTHEDINTSNIIIATPGKLIDHLQNSLLDFNNLEMLVLDEADRLYDNTFRIQLDTIRKYVPGNVQTVMFSATYPDTLKCVMNEFMKDKEGCVVGQGGLHEQEEGVHEQEGVHKQEGVHEQEESVHEQEEGSEGVNGQEGVHKQYTSMHKQHTGMHKQENINKQHTVTHEQQENIIKQDNNEMICIEATYEIRNNVKQLFYNTNKNDKLFEILNRMNFNTNWRDNIKKEKVIIFVEKKISATRLYKECSLKGYKCGELHGDKTQVERNRMITEFINGNKPILIATSVAGRGLDFKDLNIIINYDMPKFIDEYIHRIGRTGRAGDTGTAISFYDGSCSMTFITNLIKVLQDTNQTVPDFLSNHKVNKKSGGSRSDSRSDRSSDSTKYGNDRSNKYGDRYGNDRSSDKSSKYGDSNKYGNDGSNKYGNDGGNKYGNDSNKYGTDKYGSNKHNVIHTISTQESNTYSIQGNNTNEYTTIGNTNEYTTISNTNEYTTISKSNEYTNNEYDIQSDEEEIGGW